MIFVPTYLARLNLLPEAAHRCVPSSILPRSNNDKEYLPNGTKLHPNWIPSSSFLTRETSNKQGSLAAFFLSPQRVCAGIIGHYGARHLIDSFAAVSMTDGCWRAFPARRGTNVHWLVATLDLNEGESSFPSETKLKEPHKWRNHVSRVRFRKRLILRSTATTSYSLHWT